MSTLPMPASTIGKTHERLQDIADGPGLPNGKAAAPLGATAAVVAANPQPPA